MSADAATTVRVTFDHAAIWDALPYAVIAIGVLPYAFAALRVTWPAVRELSGFAAAYASILVRESREKWLNGKQLSRYLILAGLLWLWAGSHQGQDSPAPAPHRSKAGQRYADAFAEQYRRAQKVCLMAAEMLEAGELESEEQVWKFLDLGVAEARSMANMPLKEAEQELLGEGQWTAEKHAQLLREYAK